MTKACLSVRERCPALFTVLLWPLSRKIQSGIQVKPREQLHFLSSAGVHYEHPTSALTINHEIHSCQGQMYSFIRGFRRDSSVWIRFIQFWRALGSVSMGISSSFIIFQADLELISL